MLVEVLLANMNASVAVAEAVCKAVARLADSDKHKCKLAEAGACEGLCNAICSPDLLDESVSPET